MMTIVCECPFCGKEYEVNVKLEDFLAWRQGGLVQNCFPYLSATERESLVSQMCPKCQAKVFGTEEEEETEEEEISEEDYDRFKEEFKNEFDFNDYDEEVDAAFMAYLAGHLAR